MSNDNSLIQNPHVRAEISRAQTKANIALVISSFSLLLVLILGWVVLSQNETVVAQDVPVVEGLEMAMVPDFTAPPTATAPAAVATVISPTAPAPVYYDFEFDGVKSYASLVGNGAFQLDFQVFTTTVGLYETPQDAVSASSESVMDVRAACYDGRRDFFNRSYRFGYSTGSDSGEALSGDCIAKLKTYFPGLSDTVNSELLKTLSERTNLEESGLWLYNQYGEYLGMWYGNLPADTNADCFALSVGAEYPSDVVFFVDRFEEQNSKDMYWRGLTNVPAGSLPDFCSSGNLVETGKPSWVNYYFFGKDGHESDEIFFEALDTAGHKSMFSLHTDPMECNLFPGIWPSGTIMFSSVFETEEGLFDQRPYVAIEAGDVIMIQRYGSENYDYTPEFIYLTLNSAGEVIFMKQAEEVDSNSSAYYRVPTLAVSPSVDGIENWVRYANTTPSIPYFFNGEIVEQSAPYFIEREEE